MAGYTPLFQSLFTGSLCGRFPDMYVWMVMLGLADRHGDVDASPTYIASIAGISVELVEEAIERLCQPDPRSRSQTCDGRRLVPIANRGFGWTIVNHAAYREKARLAAKSEREIESGRNAQRLQQRRATGASEEGPPATAADRRGPPATASDPLSDSDANADSDAEEEGRGKSARSKRNGKDAAVHTGMRQTDHGFVDVTSLRAEYPEAPRGLSWAMPTVKALALAIDSGASMHTIVAGAVRYREYVDATDPARAYVKEPRKWLEERGWEQPWTVPLTKAEAKQAKNIDVAREWAAKEG